VYFVHMEFWNIMIHAYTKKVVSVFVPFSCAASTEYSNASRLSDSMEI
jgi:hypothetical protein